MCLERIHHRVSEARERRSLVRGKRIASTIAAEHTLVRVKEKCRPSEVVVEIENIEIDAAHAGQPNKYELSGEVGDHGVEAGNLPVEDVAIQSVLAAKDNKEGLAALAGDFSSLTIITEPNGPLARSYGFFFEGIARNRKH
jgi:hypothetical protein